MAKLSVVGLASLLELLVLCSIKIASKESNDYVLTVANEQISFVAQPEAGYVVKTQEKTAGISSTLSDRPKKIVNKRYLFSLRNTIFVRA